MCILMWLNLNVEAGEDKYTKRTLGSTHPGWTAEIGRVSKHTPSTNSTSNFYKDLAKFGFISEDPEEIYIRRKNATNSCDTFNVIYLLFIRYFLYCSQNKFHWNCWLNTIFQYVQRAGIFLYDFAHLLRC